MATLVLIIHVLTCLFLIFIVLLQSGKGAEIGAAFGGSSQTIFGSRGAATFLNKLTTGAAIVFMLTSLTLTLVTSKSASVIKQPEPAAIDQQNTLPLQIPDQPLQPAPGQPANQPEVK